MLVSVYAVNDSFAFAGVQPGKKEAEHLVVAGRV